MEIFINFFEIVCLGEIMKKEKVKEHEVNAEVCEVKDGKVICKKEKVRVLKK
tara:strand:- start:341 stop:496 length:156 start_codon:yes stop_codon:yes gene_type:complete